MPLPPLEGGFARHLLAAPDDHIDVLRVEVEAEAAAPKSIGGDQS
jgi:hypothetical protein